MIESWIEPFLGMQGWISLLTLTSLEIVLGLDNIGVFDRSAPLPEGGCP